MLEEKNTSCSVVGKIFSGSSPAGPSSWPASAAVTLIGVPSALVSSRPSAVTRLPSKKHAFEFKITRIYLLKLGREPCGVKNKDRHLI